MPQLPPLIRTRLPASPRIRDLLRGVDPELFPFDRARKVRSFWRLLRTIRRTKPDLVVMEGTGLAGGAALIAARVLFGRRYVVSSGDAVGPWVGGRVRLLGPVFGLYERVLCRLAAGSMCVSDMLVSFMSRLWWIPADA